MRFLSIKILSISKSTNLIVIEILTHKISNTNFFKIHYFPFHIVSALIANNSNYQ